MRAPPIVAELVARFERNLDTYCSASYNETQVRREFIDPLFIALGWDIENRQGYAEAYKDVIHEDAIKVGGATQAPDYCFRVGGRRIFFLEAKKPAVNVREEVSPAYQLRRYAWSAKLPLSILTDFEELAVYDCRVRPDPADKASTSRILLLRYTDYVDRWDELANIFSRDAVLKGSFDKFAEGTRLKRGTAEVDAAFLEEIESWRETLAKNFALRNPNLDTRELNFAVQRTIDRVVFLRMCEDRGIELYGQLQSLLNGEACYRRLCDLFRLADERYNSGLFHFQPEKDRVEPPDELTTRLALDDKPLKEIVRKLYYPDSPYEFSVLPAEILGQVYEQFLGKVIRLTSGHRAVVEDKPDVKKAGGVYYTPAYIVEYIVVRTVGKLVEGQNPRQAAKLRILDPACGSGSFLVGAYSFLLDWHRDWYVSDGPAKHTKVLYQGAGGQWHLTTAEKKRILLNNIYGVDIDTQAVEVTKLSLLLKVLEDENRESLERQRRFLHERALPDLGANIKCGNSLIGPDFYNGQQRSLLDEEEQYHINEFDWPAEFSAALKQKNAGFDAVIGNPPWGATFSVPELRYLRIKYRRVVARMVDSYIYFWDQALRLAKQSSPVGFVIPSTILNQVDAQPVRELLLDRGLTSLASLGAGVFGPKVLNTTTVIVSSPISETGAFFLCNASERPIADRKNALLKPVEVNWKEWEQSVRNDPHVTFFVGPQDGNHLLDRLRRGHRPLKDVVRGTIQRGVSPDIAAAHVVPLSEAKADHLESELLRPSVSGAQIKRYREWRVDRKIVLTTRDTKLARFPNVGRRLHRFRHLNTCNEVRQGKHPWWSLHRPRDPEIFQSPKLIGLTTSRTIELIYDAVQSVYVTDAMYVFHLVPAVDPLACMAIMQSRLFLFLYRVANQGESRVIPQVKASKLQELPFPAVHEHERRFKHLAEHAASIIVTNRKRSKSRTPHQRVQLERRVAVLDRQIDQLVFQLYGLTDDEIALVEGNVTAAEPNEE